MKHDGVLVAGQVAIDQGLGLRIDDFDMRKLDARFLRFLFDGLRHSNQDRLRHPHLDHSRSRPQDTRIRRFRIDNSPGIFRRAFAKLINEVGHQQLFYSGHAVRTLALLLDLDSVAFDLLIEGRKWDPEIVGGFRLAPAGLLEHLDDHAPLE